MSMTTTARKPLVLLILDGWGVRASREGNAIALAKTPTFRSLYKQWPHSTLAASGKDVGLPPKFIGNSEVGHLTIGSGRIIEQLMTIINRDIANGRFFKNKALNDVMNYCKRKKKTLHLLGLVQSAGVHAMT